MRRKKWSEDEEQTLISKYAEMASAGALAKLKTREKKFEPIAAHVNAVHHFRDNVSFPWEWSWRDLSVKIQNMRNQYLGVKQKVRRAPSTTKELGQQQQQLLLQQEDEFEWNEGIVHWSNFLLYKEVFGDLELDSNELVGTGGGSPSSTLINNNNNNINYKSFDGGNKLVRGRGRLTESSSRVRHGFNGNSRLPGWEDGRIVGSSLDVEDIGGGEVGGPGSGLGLECYADDDDDGRDLELEEDLGSKKKKRVKRHRDPVSSDSDGGGPVVLTEGKILAFLGAYVTEQRERDAQREEREREKEREREEREFAREVTEREREHNRVDRERSREEQERRREREREDREWERDLVNRDRWEEEKQKERAWQEKREIEKQEWRRRMTALQLGHQATITQMQAQMMQSQQNVVSLLLRVLLHGSPVEETPGQRSSLALQIVHNLQQQHDAAVTDSLFQSGERKGGGIDDSATQYVINGGDDMMGAH